MISTIDYELNDKIKKILIDVRKKYINRLQNKYIMKDNNNSPSCTVMYEDGVEVGCNDFVYYAFDDVSDIFNEIRREFCKRTYIAKYNRNKVMFALCLAVCLPNNVIETLKKWNDIMVYIESKKSKLYTITEKHRSNCCCGHSISEKYYIEVDNNIWIISGNTCIEKQKLVETDRIKNLQKYRKKLHNTTINRKSIKKIKKIKVTSAYDKIEIDYNIALKKSDYTINNGYVYIEKDVVPELSKCLREYETNLKKNNKNLTLKSIFANNKIKIKMKNRKKIRKFENYKKKRIERFEVHMYKNAKMCGICLSFLS